ncbi:aromatase/cyclase [Amycolatopsis sp. NPDC049688]|uniref:aromatase/cyclase n=1 Tax=Amycolatopsis sp. NPDC049688 TaxID=3154733 RepID=UPI00341B8229
MTTGISEHTSHRIDIGAPPAVVYDIIADAVAWPQYFTPTVHVERVEGDGSAERLRIWALANGKVSSWTSARTLDEGRRRVGFRQEVSTAPVASMRGEWIVEPADGGGTRLVLEHEFTAVEDDARGLAWITEATNANSETELGNIKVLAESWDALGDLVFSFEDSTVVRAPAKTVYAFLHEAAKWPERLPHVASLQLTEEVENVQWMAMETRTGDGASHTTESVRICFPDERIVYKQLRTPSLMTAHTGEWIVRDTGDGVLVTSQHVVTVNEAAITGVLGAGADVAAARAFIRRAAGGNSAATLALAKQFAEAHHAG